MQRCSRTKVVEGMFAVRKQQQTSVFGGNSWFTAEDIGKQSCAMDMRALSMTRLPATTRNLHGKAFSELRLLDPLG